jgi:predicted nucleic acid-binding protein
VKGYLLDTNVISDLRRSGPNSARLRTWFDAQSPERLYVSVVTLGEIRQGIEQVRRRDRLQADHLSQWLNELGRFYADRLVPVDLAVAEEWGRLRAIRSVPVVDALIAATARVHGLTLVTRNVKDVVGLGVTTMNPAVHGHGI